MQKVLLIVFLAFGLLAFTEKIFGQELYKWVDEKGTVHFSDNPTSVILGQEKERPREDGLEVLKRLEGGNRPQTATTGAKSIVIDYSQGSGGSGSGGGSTMIRSGRS